MVLIFTFALLNSPYFYFYIMFLSPRLQLLKKKRKEINLDNGNLKMVQDDIEINDCEAYGVAPSALATSSRMDYEQVFLRIKCFV